MFLHHLYKPVKQIGGIVRSRRGLRVVLYGKQGNLLVQKSLHCIVIQIDMARLNVRIFQGFHIHTEPVVLGRNLHLSGGQILYGLVGAPVAKLQLKGLSSQGQSCQLVPQAYSENRPLSNLLLEVC